MSGRLLVTIADQHLRPRRHLAECADQCAPRCPVREYEADLAEPVLRSEIAAAKAEEERLKALVAAASNPNP